MSLAGEAQGAVPLTQQRRMPAAAGPGRRAACYEWTSPSKTVQTETCTAVRRPLPLDSSKTMQINPRRASEAEQILLFLPAPPSSPQETRSIKRRPIRTDSARPRAAKGPAERRAEHRAPQLTVASTMLPKRRLPAGSGDFASALSLFIPSGCFSDAF